jgi:transposase
MGSWESRSGFRRKYVSGRCGWCWTTRRSTALSGPTIRSIAGKIGCAAETLRNWVGQAERDRGIRPGLTTEERRYLKELERENGELRSANRILRKARAYFAQAELDRRAK